MSSAPRHALQLYKSLLRSSKQYLTEIERGSIYLPLHSEISLLALPHSKLHHIGTNRISQTGIQFSKKEREEVSDFIRSQFMKYDSNSLSDNDLSALLLAGRSQLTHLEDRVKCLSQIVYSHRSKSTDLNHSVTVRVQSTYLANQSRPENNHFAFAYRVKIENFGQETITLLSRSWKILDSSNLEQVVSGPGVVGQQPSLKPKDKFEYVSSAALVSPVGTMSGHFTFLDMSTGDEFNVKINPFSLLYPASKDTNNGGDDNGSSNNNNNNNNNNNSGIPPTPPPNN